MRIGLDIMGGDFAPAEAIKGVLQFFEQSNDSNVHLVLVGNAQAAEPYLPLLEAFKSRYTLVDTPEVIGMNEHPTKALKEKPNSSIAVGFGLLVAGKADAFIGAGNTGAMMVGAMYSVKTIEGILRPTIATPVPCNNGDYNFLLDVGANADCKPEHLVQFAQLGSIYVSKVWNKTPKVGLLNIGEEEGKGNILAQATYPLLKANENINFIGNVEGRDVFLDTANVIVCEGFVGNVVLKMAESIHHIFKARGVQDEFLEHFNYEIYGGTPILGVNSPVIIGHGISQAVAFCNMIKMASQIVEADLVNVFKSHFANNSATA